MTNKGIRLIIVVRADPVICGHSGEARHLAEAAMRQGFSEVRILTWTLEAIADCGLPTKPLDAVAPYGDGIFVERPQPLGDYRVPDGRHLAGLSGRLLELLCEDMDSVVMCLYLHPHLSVVAQAVQAARQMGSQNDIRTIAEAVGSDITNVVRSALEQGQRGAAQLMLSQYLSQDLPIAVSHYTKGLIVEAAARLDEGFSTSFERVSRERIQISYPAVNATELMLVEQAPTDHLKHRRLERNGYILFLSRLAKAKGADDLIEGYRHSKAYGRRRLVIAGCGPEEHRLRELIGSDPHISLLTDVDDEEKLALMHGCAAYVLPSKPRPEFVETFGIALVEKMLVGGLGPVLTTDTGGIGEAVGDAALSIEADNPQSITRALDHALFELSERTLLRMSRSARQYALRFDRAAVLKSLLGKLERLPQSLEAELELDLDFPLTPAFHQLPPSQDCEKIPIS